MENIFKSNYNRQNWINFLKNKFLPGDFSLRREQIDIDFKSKYIKPQAYWIGDCESLGDLAIIEISHSSEQDPRIGVSRDAFRLMAEYGLSKALFFFVSDNSNNYRFSLITLDLKLEGTGVKYKFSNPKRFSFFLGEEAKIHTPEEFLIRKGRIKDFEDLKNRFSIEVVNKEFYNNIQRLFYKLVGGKVKQSSKKLDFAPMLKLPSTQDHKTMQEFGVRLIGRLVFCWFLKKKKSDAGIPLIPKKILSSDAVKENYYHNTIEPLFFELLNTPINIRRDDFRSTEYDLIPFLNGGLFDPNLHEDYYRYSPMEKEYKPSYNLVIPDEWLEEFIALLETYNFTIDENTSVDIDLSVDPEMLGRIFENLLAEINPETGNTARKATGSYYTPRPIVEYMVDESLIQYLLTKTDIEETAIRELLDYNIEVTELSKEKKIAVIDALDEIKVLDPACGSGAFPMGILQKMLLILQKVDPESIEWVMRQLDKIPNKLVRQALEDKLMNENWKYKHKMGIIQNAIYGVDIQIIATEISKLRLFLTLIVDENIIDEKENRNIHPLPNLSFKFVTANTLIGLGKTPDLDDWTVKQAYEECVTDMEKVREQYFYEFDKTRKAQLEKKIKEIQKRLFYIVTDFQIHSDYFNKLISWNPFEDKASDWFDSSWMFGISEGFDIVIGNPPYIKEYTDRHAFDGLRDSPYYQGKMDIWYFFACRNLDLLKDNGILSFIATNNWVTNFGASKMRKKVVFETQILKLIDFNNFKIFESVGIQTMIMIFKKNKYSDNYKLDYRKLKKEAIDFTDVFDLLKFIKTDNNIIIKPTLVKSTFVDKPLVFNNPRTEKILKIIQDAENLNLFDDEVAQGVVFPQDFLNNKNQKILGDNFKVGDGIFALNDDELNSLHLNENEMTLIKPYFTTAELGKYYGTKKNKYWLIYTTSKFNNHVEIKPFQNIKKHLDKFSKVITSDNKPYGLHRARKEKFFKGEKIFALRKCSNEPVFTFTDFDCYVSASFYVIKTDRLDLKTLTCFLNSKICAYWLRNKGKMQGNNYQIDKEPLLQIPIPKISKERQKLFEFLVDKILQMKERETKTPRLRKSESTHLQEGKHLENQIDLMVYKLYELTYEEVKIVDPEFDKVLAEFGLSKENYERMSVEGFACLAEE